MCTEISSFWSFYIFFFIQTLHFVVILFIYPIPKNSNFLKHTMKFPYGELVFTVKFSYGEISVRPNFLRRNILTTKFPYGKISLRWNFLTEKYPTAKHLTAKYLTMKFPGAWKYILSSTKIVMLKFLHLKKFNIKMYDTTPPTFHISWCFVRVLNRKMLYTNKIHVFVCELTLYYTPK